MTNDANQNSVIDELPISLDAFIQRMGISDTTAWRWRRDKMLDTENILGRVYVTPEAIREFNRKIKAGEFNKKHKAPQREKVMAA